MFGSRRRTIGTVNRWNLPNKMGQVVVRPDGIELMLSGDNAFWRYAFWR